MDKTTLALPESPELAKEYGWHKANKALGTVGAELACLFCAVARAPIAFAHAKANTSEDKLFQKLLGQLPPLSVLLVDAGYYSFALFQKIRLDPTRHFVVPASLATRPRMVKKLGPHEYLAEIADSKSKGVTMLVRVIFVYRDGFRRRRLVTSLLDPDEFPAAEVATLYRQRWAIETFYREFKVSMQANQWHCESAENFKKELACQMIVACMAKLAMGEAAAAAGLTPGSLSFAHAYVGLKRLFLRALRSAGSGEGSWEDDRRDYIGQCAKHKARGKPGRSYPRDKQQYRRKSRGLLKKRRGRPHIKVERQKRPEPETLTNLKGMTVLLG